MINLIIQFKFDSTCQQQQKGRAHRDPNGAPTQSHQFVQHIIQFELNDNFIYFNLNFIHLYLKEY